MPAAPDDLAHDPLVDGNRIFAVLRTPNTRHALTVGAGLGGTAVSGIEVTMTVPDAVGVIDRLVRDGVRRVGAGTVRTVVQLQACVDAGAEFIVCPHLDDGLVTAAVRLGVPIVPGVLTPSEVVRALALGASAVKLFPVSAVGGVAYVRALLEPLPDARFLVSGEAQLNEVAAYLAAGAWGVCIGGSLWRVDDAEGGDTASVTAFAAAQLTAASRPQP